MHTKLLQLACWQSAQLFATSWTVACQSPLSMEFPRQEYWSGLPCPPTGDLTNPGIELPSLMSLALAGRFFTSSTICKACMKVKVSHSVVSDSLQPHRLYSPWSSPGQNTGVGSPSFLQGIFPTQGSNPGLLHCRWILYQLSHKPKNTGVGSLSLFQGICLTQE